ncbi:MAG TPA: FkbM family methyltransferase [Flavisolibacter sp.]|nr:FkbM family methyltransferase [Flavisolibacter sp.]
MEKVPSYYLKAALLKVGYARNKKNFKSFQTIDKNYIYEVDGYFVPSTSFGWYVGIDTIKADAYALPLFNYTQKQEDVIIDIGAGLGEESLALSQMVNHGQIYAIEANVKIFQVLSKVLELNKIANVIPFNLAIAENNGEVQLIEDDASFLSGSIGNKIKDKSQCLSVRGVRLDTFIEENNIHRIDLIKSNIEGAERFVISSIGEKIQSVKNFAIACHDFRWKAEQNEFFKTKELVTTFLKDNGYKVCHQNTGREFYDDWVYGTRL